MGRENTSKRQIAEVGKGLRRVWISEDVNEDLEKIVGQVNKDFDGGKINRSQIISWMVKKMVSECCASDIQEIRLANLDELSVLEAMVKKARSTGVMPSDLSELVLKQLRGSGKPKKMVPTSIYP